MCAAGCLSAAAGTEITILQYPDIITLFLAGHTHRLVPLKEFAPGQWTVQPKDNGAGMAKIRLNFDPAQRPVRRGIIPAAPGNVFFPPGRLAKEESNGYFTPALKILK